MRHFAELCCEVEQGCGTVAGGGVGSRKADRRACLNASGRLNRGGEIDEAEQGG